jgi:hypothetical protein
MATASAALRNGSGAWTPGASGGKTQNKSGKGGKKKGKGKAKNKADTPARAAASKPNGTPRMTANAAEKLFKAGVTAGKKMNAAPPKKEANKKKGKGKAKNKRANGSGGWLGWLTSPFQRQANPSLGDFGATLRVAGIGLVGGAASRIESAVALAVADRFVPSYSRSPWASPIVTVLMALVATPRIMDYFGMSEASQRLAVTGGILFGAAEGLNVLTGGDKVGEIADSLRVNVGGALNKLTKGGGAGGVTASQLATAAAEEARAKALAAGLSPETANAAAAGAAAGTLSGLSGSTDVLESYDYSGAANARGGGGTYTDPALFSYWGNNVA